MNDQFQRELNMINDEGVRSFTEYVLDHAPPYFFLVPSSSTGKYHSKQSNGTGGLVRHSKAVAYFADIFCRAYNLEGKDRDVAISASVLHDLIKYGMPMQKFTTKTHDKEAADFIFKLGISYSADENNPNVSKQTVLEICKAVAYHFGRWTTEDRRKSFPEDYSKIEQVVHLADMASAGKDVNLGFLEETNLIG